MIHESTRTLVKSQPEIWEQCSDPESLARHLNGSFGEIRITRLEPESTVAWEGEHASGTVMIESSAWGTRVTLTAQTEADPVEGEPEAEAVVEPEEVETVVEAVEEPDEVEVVVEAVEAEEAAIDEVETVDLAATARPAWKRDRFGGLLVRFWRGRARPPAVPTLAPLTSAGQAVSREAEPERLQAPEPVTPDPEAEVVPEAQAILSAALESLGQAHHRPYSRS